MDQSTKQSIREANKKFLMKEYKMFQNKKTLIVALIVPILSLIALTSYKKYILAVGYEIVLPISGYDPRDLLSGHYITYRIEYGISEICSNQYESRIAYVCLEPNKSVNFSVPLSCTKMIEGECNYGQFKAGIEKYFVPEDKAKYLESQIRSKSASIVLSVTRNGRAQVKDLLLDGQPWKDLPIDSQ